MADVGIDLLTAGQAKKLAVMLNLKRSECWLEIDDEDRVGYQLNERPVQFAIFSR